MRTLLIENDESATIGITDSKKFWNERKRLNEELKVIKDFNFLLFF